MLDASTSAQLVNLIGGELAWVSVSIAMATKMTIEVRLKVSDEAVAAIAVSTLTITVDRVRGQLEPLIGEQFSDSISVDQDRSLLRVTGTLNADEAEKLLSLVKMMPM